MILVTGASGFLGSHLLQALEEQPIAVRALYHTKKPITNYKNVEWRQCDLLDVFETEAVMKGITHVYHCAAIVSFDPKKKDEVIQNNISATANVINAALDADIVKLIHVSSIAALGRNILDSGQTILIDEETYFEENKNNSSYSQGKYLAEMEVWRGMAEGLNAAIVNPGIILGEGDWDNGSANLMKIVYKEFPWYTQGINGWVDVKDVVNALVLLMNSNVSDQRFIISEDNYSYLDIFTQMAEALQRKPPHQLASPFITNIVWRVEYLKSLLTSKAPTISKETARTAQLQCTYDNTKFQNTFPSFTYTPMKDTIQRMAYRFKEDYGIK